MADWTIWDERVGKDILYRPLPPSVMVVNGGVAYRFDLKSTGPKTLNEQATGLEELANLHKGLITPNLIATGTGDDPTQKNPQAIVRKPWLDPPDSANPFDPTGTVALPAVGNEAVILAFTVPTGRDGVINAYSWNFISTGTAFTQGSGDLVAQLRRNGTPVRNYENITTEKGCVQIPRTIVPLRIYSKDLIELVIIHEANVGLTGNVVGGLTGYDYLNRG